MCNYIYSRGVSNRIFRPYLLRSESYSVVTLDIRCIKLSDVTSSAKYPTKAITWTPCMHEMRKNVTWSSAVESVTIAILGVSGALSRDERKEKGAKKKSAEKFFFSSPLPRLDPPWVSEDGYLPVTYPEYPVSV